MHGLCPKCGAQLTHVAMDPVEASSDTERMTSVAFLCPYCHVVLGVTADPIAIQSDTVNSILKRLGRG